MNQNLGTSSGGIIPSTLDAIAINHGHASAPVVQTPCMNTAVYCQSETTPDTEIPASLAPLSASFPSTHALLDGIRLFVQFLLSAECDYLCGVPLRARSSDRINYRGGYRHRKLRTPHGTITLRTPFLRYLHPRVSIAKRAKRLSPDIFAQLVRIHAAGVTTSAAAALIKTLWTVALPDKVLATLVANLVPLLEEWRVQVLQAPQPELAEVAAP